MAHTNTIETRQPTERCSACHQGQVSRVARRGGFVVRICGSDACVPPAAPDRPVVVTDLVLIPNRTLIR